MTLPLTTRRHDSAQDDDKWLCSEKATLQLTACNTKIESYVHELLNFNNVLSAAEYADIIIEEQLAGSERFSDACAAITASLNRICPRVGEILLPRLVHQLQSAIGQQDYHTCTASLRFVSDLYRHRVSDSLLPMCLIDSLVYGSTSPDSARLGMILLTFAGSMLARTYPRAVSAAITRVNTAKSRGQLQLASPRELTNFIASCKEIADNSEPPAWNDWSANGDTDETHSVMLTTTSAINSTAKRAERTVVDENRWDKECSRSEALTNVIRAKASAAATTLPLRSSSNADRAWLHDLWSPGSSIFGDY
jgi:hypothetical protein